MVLAIFKVESTAFLFKDILKAFKISSFQVLTNMTLNFENVILVYSSHKSHAMYSTSGRFSYFLSTVFFYQISLINSMRILRRIGGRDY